MRKPILLAFLISHLWLVACFSLRNTIRTVPPRFSITPQRSTSDDEDEPLTTPNSLRQHSQQSTLNNLAKLITSTAVVAVTSDIETARATAFLFPPPSSSELKEWDGKHATIQQEDLILPLIEFDGVWTVNYTIGAVMFRAIVDTGSPFLIVPSVCSRSWGGCSQTGRFPLARCDLDPTIESFGGQSYDTNWRQTAINFPSIPPAYATQNRLLSWLGLGAMTSVTTHTNTHSLGSTPLISRRFDDLIVANVGKQILLPPGGVFLGLIKFKSKDIRPTLLSQLGYSSLRFDPRGGTLTLSQQSMVPRANLATVPTVKLVDLRTLGDPVCHYAALIKSLEINGQAVAVDSTVFAVFDTGTSGCIISDDLANDLFTPSPIRSIRLVLETEQGDDLVLFSGATREEMFIVFGRKIPWFDGMTTPTPTPTSTSADNDNDNDTDSDTDSDNNGQGIAATNNGRFVAGDGGNVAERSSNSNSNNEEEDGRKTSSSSSSSNRRRPSSVRDEEFDSLVQQQRNDYSPRDSPGISDEDVKQWRDIHDRLLRKPVVVVLGLTFLRKAMVTIDIDDGRMAYQPYSS